MKKWVDEREYNGEEILDYDPITHEYFIDTSEPEPDDIHWSEYMITWIVLAATMGVLIKIIGSNF
jgi:hypothetical protein